MPTTSNIVYNKGEWSYLSDALGNPTNQLVSLEVRDSGSAPFVQATETKVSVNSPNQWKKIIVYVPYKPHKGKVPTRPREPSYFPPPAPLLYARRPNQSNLSWSRALKRHEIRISTFRAKVVRLEARYEQRMDKYKVRLAKYEAYLKKSINGVPSKKRVKTKNDSQWNPFSLMRSFNTGPVGTMTAYMWNWYYWVPLKSQQIIRGSLTAFGQDVRNYLAESKPTAMISRVLAATDSLARNRFHDRLTNEQVHLGQVIAERAQTVGLLVDAVKRLSDFLRHFSVSHLAKTLIGRVSKTGVRNNANDVLAFKFGVEPLIGDVQGAAEAVARFVVDKIDSHEVLVKASASRSEEETFTITVDGRVIVVTQRVHVHTRFVCQYELDNIVTREMSQLGVLNPAELLWELVPWSFVVDWVYTLGNYIRHLTSDAGLQFSRGTYSTKVTWSVTAHATKQEGERYNPQLWGVDSWRHEDWSQTYGGDEKTRVLLNQSPYVQAPNFKNPISINHLVESLALLFQSTRFK